MDELIVRLARTIACMPRLGLLSAIGRADEISPSELARQLGMSRHLVSAHLLRLSAVALIQRRRSGAWHYCRAGSPYRAQTLSGELASWLQAVLGGAKGPQEDLGVQQLRDPPGEDLADPPRVLVFDAATAFRSVRRLQILRYVSGTPASSATLCGELHMSHAAAARHLGKLVGRGFVVAGRSRRRAVYRLATAFATAVHARLFEIISEHW